MATLQCMRIQDDVEIEGGSDQPLGLSSFVGTWYNTNPNSRGVVKIVINVRDGPLRVQIFGAADHTARLG